MGEGLTNAAKADDAQDLWSSPRPAIILWGCVFSPRDPRAKRLKNPLRIPPQTPTVSQLTWFWVTMGNTQGSRGFTFPSLTGKQARISGPRPMSNRLGHDHDLSECMISATAAPLRPRTAVRALSCPTTAARPGRQTLRSVAGAPGTPLASAGAPWHQPREKLQNGSLDYPAELGTYE